MDVKEMFKNSRLQFWTSAEINPRHAEIFISLFPLIESFPAAGKLKINRCDADLLIQPRCERVSKYKMDLVRIEIMSFRNLGGFFPQIVANIFITGGSDSTPNVNATLFEVL